MYQNEFGANDKRQDTSKQSFAYEPVEVEHLNIMGTGDASVQHLRREIRLMEEKKQAHDSDMRQLMNSERMKTMKA